LLLCLLLCFATKTWIITLIILLVVYILGKSKHLVRPPFPCVRRLKGCPDFSASLGNVFGKCYVARGIFELCLFGVFTAVFAFILYNFRPRLACKLTVLDMQTLSPHSLKVAIFFPPSNRGHVLKHMQKKFRCYLNFMFNKILSSRFIPKR